MIVLSFIHQWFVSFVDFSFFCVSFIFRVWTILINNEIFSFFKSRFFCILYSFSINSIWINQLFINFSCLISINFGRWRFYKLIMFQIYILLHLDMLSTQWFGKPSSNFLWFSIFLRLFTFGFFLGLTLFLILFVFKWFLSLFAYLSLFYLRKLVSIYLILQFLMLRFLNYLLCLNL